MGETELLEKMCDLITEQSENMISKAVPLYKYYYARRSLIDGKPSNIEFLKISANDKLGRIKDTFLNHYRDKRSLYEIVDAVKSSKATQNNQKNKRLRGILKKSQTSNATSKRNIQSNRKKKSVRTVGPSGI